MADIEEVDVLAVCETGDFFIHFNNLKPPGIGGFFRPGKHREQQDLAGGRLSADFLNDCGDALGNPGAVSRRLLFVPIINTTTFGWMPVRLPFLRRQRTCSVLSPPIPKLAALSGA